MQPVSSCFDHAQLRDVLGLPAESGERAALDSHVQHCDSCRRLLLNITSEAVRQTLTRPPEGERMTTDLSGGRTQAKASSQEPLSSQEVRARELTFLDPPRDPKNLGRLAHYELIEAVGRGGMGTVFRAHDDTLHRMVAVKMMSPELAASDTARQRFIREARAAAQVMHEHVVAIHAVDDGRRIPFLVMQYVEGISLQHRLWEGPLEVDEIVRIGQEIAEGLAAAHAKGLVHRDIKPGNILLEKPNGKVKITDFGLARAVDDASLSQSGAVIGTPLYMAPEQARGDALDHRADLFSLGAVLYALCTGGSPFRANSSLAAMKRVCEDDPESIRLINPKIPLWLEEIIRKLLAKEPRLRYQTADEVAVQLGARLCSANFSDERGTGSRTEIISAIRKRSRRPFWFAGTALLLAVGAALFLLVREKLKEMRKNEDPTPIAKAKSKDPLPGPDWKNTIEFPALPEGNPEIPAIPPGLDGMQIPPGIEALFPRGMPLLDPGEAFPAMMEWMKQNHPLLAKSGAVPKQASMMFRAPFAPAAIGAVANSPDGNMVAIAFGDQIALFNAAGKYLLNLQTPSQRIASMAFSADSTWLVAGLDTKQNNLIAWELHEGMMVENAVGHAAGINQIAFDKDRYVTASSDGTAKIWNLRQEKPLAVLGTPGQPLRCAAFDKDGKRVFTAGDDSRVHVWNAQTGAEIKSLGGHTASIRRIAFNPLGDVLVTGSESEVKIWNAATLQLIQTLHTGGGWLAFSPLGDTLYTAACDHRDGSAHHVTLWNTRTWDEKTSYPLRTKGGTAIFHLSVDGALLMANRANPAPDPAAMLIYLAASGRDLLGR